MRVLYECKALAIGTYWDERTTERFDMEMLKTDWAGHQRGKLRFMSECLTFENWTIPYGEIDDAVVTRVRGVVPAWYLRIKAQGESYQFCPHVWKGSYFRDELPFTVRRAFARGFGWLYVLGILALVFGPPALVYFLKGK